MPNKDQTIGALIFLVCVAVAIGYTATLLFPQYLLGWLEPRTVQLWIVAIPVLVAFLALLSIGAWIGWTMATTPSPKPLEEMSQVHQLIGKDPESN